MTRSGPHRRGIVLAVIVALALVAACAEGDDTVSSPDAGSPDVGLPDAGSPDAELPATPTDRSGTSTSDGTANGDGCEHRDLHDEPYADDSDLQQLDLYYPDATGGDASCDALPLVVWVHGGGWTTGDKANTIDGKLASWGARGWAVASVNYRLSDEQVPEDERVLAPTHNEDVAAAVAWLVDHAGDLALDPDRVALVGHSAGGGILAALVADPTYLGAHDQAADDPPPDDPAPADLAPADLAPADLACVGLLDTEGYDLVAATGAGGRMGALYRNAFGADPDWWEALSPLAHVGEAPTPPLLVVTRGLPSRRGVATGFADAVRTAGGDVQVVALTGYSHADVNRRIGDPTDTRLTPALLDFLDGCLAPA